MAASDPPKKRESRKADRSAFPAFVFDVDSRRELRSPDVLQRHLHPALTSWALRRYPAGRRVHLEDRVADHDLFGTPHEEGRPASGAAASVLVDFHGARKIPIVDRNCQEYAWPGVSAPSNRQSGGSHVTTARGHPAPLQPPPHPGAETGPHHGREAA